MTARDYQHLPETHLTYVKIIKSLIPIVGKKTNKKNKALPKATYSVDQLSIDKTNLEDYRRICGFADTGQVPPTYFAVLSQALQMNMMVDEPFPFPMLGLVHIANSVTQYRRISDSDTFTMQVSFGDLRDHDKGKQFDFITKVYQDETLVWEGTSTYLSRQKSNTDKQDKKIKELTAKPEAKQDDLHHVFAVPDDIGRRYARVSGDFNLIHLHPVTAKVLGFPQAIAHGMWSKAKCLSLMDLPEAYKVEVAFKLPIFLPSEVELIGKGNSRQLTDSGIFEFNLYSAKEDKPHLAGKVTVVDAAEKV